MNRAVALLVLAAKTFLVVCVAVAVGLATYNFGVHQGWIDKVDLTPSGNVVAKQSVAAPGVNPDPSAPPGSPEDPGYLLATRSADAVNRWRWDPCSGPVHYKVNAAGGPAHAVEDVQWALARVTDATGLQFEYTGPTGYIPQKDWTNAKDWPAPLVIAWAKAGPGGAAAGASDLLPVELNSADPLHSEAVGSWSGFITTMPETDRTLQYKFAVITRGVIVIDATNSGYLNERPLDAPGGLGALLMHEAGHAIGLDHTGVRGNIMYPQLQEDLPTVWGPGDIEGLRQVGASYGCTDPLISAPTPHKS